MNTIFTDREIRLIRNTIADKAEALLKSDINRVRMLADDYLEVLKKINDLINAQ